MEPFSTFISIFSAHPAAQRRPFILGEMARFVHPTDHRLARHFVAG
jgi:hypothetical protein